MREYIARVLINIANWLVKANPPELLRARELTMLAENLKEVSGEYKRHIVYAQLIKEFPQAPKRFLSMQIEKALN